MFIQHFKLTQHNTVLPVIKTHLCVKKPSTFTLLNHTLAVLKVTQNVLCLTRCTDVSKNNTLRIVFSTSVLFPLKFATGYGSGGYQPCSWSTFLQNLVPVQL